MSDSWIDFLFGMLFSALTLAILGGIAAGAYGLYWDLQEKRECVSKGIPLAACEHYYKHDVKLDQSE